MSAIAGILRFDGAPIAARQIAPLTRAMAHRSPDGINHWTGGSVALGHGQLRATPEAVGDVQPVLSCDETLALVMDGRLDNRQELIGALQSNGIAVLGLSDAARGPSDSTLVLGAYQLWHTDCASHLLGDFAFAVWDRRRQQLFCVRDHFGAKPLHYFLGETFFAFASEEDAFLALSEIPCRPSHDRIAGWLVGALDGHDIAGSSFEAIKKLAPASSLVVAADGRTSLQSYWQLLPQEEARFRSEADCAEAFRAVFAEAVRRRLRSFGDPALMLSGGIDSASIAGAAYQILSAHPNRKLHTFSVISDDAAACAETRNIRAIVSGHDETAHVVAAPSFDGIITPRDLREAAWSNTHPVVNSIVLPAMMYLAAARAGCRVMLDGVDGDLTTLAPLYYPALLVRSGRWRAAWAECRYASRNNTYLRSKSALDILAHSAWQAYAPQSLKWLRRALIPRPRSSPINPFVNPDFVREAAIEEKLQAWQAPGQVPLSEQERHISALLPVGIPRAMEGFDLTAGRYGVEARHPWADKDLVAFYLRLPLHYKVRRGWTKALVREATVPWLNDSIRWNMGKDHLGRLFIAPLLEQVARHTDDIVREAERVARPYLDTARLAAGMREFRAGQATPRDMWALYEALTLVHWLTRVTSMRRHVEFAGECQPKRDGS